MATRMMTLFYGDKPEADVEPGNRVDTVDDLPVASLPPMPMDAPTEWTSHAHVRRFALGRLVRRLAAAVRALVVSWRNPRLGK